MHERFFDFGQHVYRKYHFQNGLCSTVSFCTGSHTYGTSWYQLIDEHKVSFCKKFWEYYVCKSGEITCCPGSISWTRCAFKWPGSWKCSCGIAIARPFTMGTLLRVINCCPGSIAWTRSTYEWSGAWKCSCGITSSRHYILGTRLRVSVLNLEANMGNFLGKIMQRSYKCLTYGRTHSSRKNLLCSATFSCWSESSWRSLWTSCRRLDTWLVMPIRKVWNSRKFSRTRSSSGRTCARIAAGMRLSIASNFSARTWKCLGPLKILFSRRIVWFAIVFTKMKPVIFFTQLILLIKMIQKLCTSTSG